MKVAVICALMFFLTQTSHSAELPEFYEDLIKHCNVEDQTSLDKCLLEIFDKMKEHLADGIPEWNIPAMEPLKIRGISFNQGGGNTKIRAQFSALKVYGLSNYTVTYAKSDPSQYKFSLGLKFPNLHLDGEYNIHGNLLLIPIKGRGPFWADFNDVTADSYNWLDIVHPAGLTQPGRLLLSQTQTDFNIKEVELRLEDLFNKDEFLGETVNTFLNENAQDIIREVKPQFAQEIDRIVLRVFTEALSSLPVEMWEKLARQT